ncbi:hypothetical protein PGTUg99_033433 [Puccinia graminis f. sp. tritici]|uniref:Uncharacterized protein n=2 Tax=Puccinia graminis f. sp. tritici TaxID=56615 RepID=E3K7N2_PUCGT|nr:uncharacterized protein PGTG_06286 [Puccinia graminis f. sp. tritici CRL 75-36-700-3]EFP80330.1 hypothetical protein PGTG_06286 [Puccinia graminis f. sp. tritici CRL 75-36-700-3]KAA1095835.1 hypothetical protein PGTUg99_033433 [Puccinia graminis f. sp. tritici]
MAPTTSNPNSNSNVLCEETQISEELLVHATPRTAPIHLDYLVYVRNVKPAVEELNHIVETTHPWAKVSPKVALAPLVVDMQAMTWNEFQSQATTHLGGHQPWILEVLSDANDFRELKWHAWIAGDLKYPEHKYARIHGHLDFLDFASTAYKAFPSKVTFKLDMYDPCHASKGPGLFLIRTDSTPSAPKQNDRVVGSAHQLGLFTRQFPANAGDQLSTTEEDEPLVTNTTARPELTNRGAQVPMDSPTPFRSFRDGGMPGLRRTDTIFNLARPQPKAPTEAPLGQSPSKVAPARKQGKSRLMSSDIEVIQGARKKPVQSLSLKRPRLSKPGAKVPLGPAEPRLEEVDFETFLNVAHVDPEDSATRKRLKDNDIIHWSFFRSSNEEELKALGFTIGMARLLCEGVPRLEKYIASHAVTESGSPIF